MGADIYPDPHDYLLACLAGLQDADVRAFDLATGVRLLVREELARRDASVLGDPDVGEASKSSAGQQLAKRRWSLRRRV